jgi:hypothetical protein
MWTYKEGTWIYWDGTFQADRFIGDGSGLTNLPGGGTETDPIFMAASSAFVRTELDPFFNASSAAMNTQISSSSNAIIASGASWTRGDINGTAASNAIVNYTTVDNDATSAALLRNIVISTASAGMTVTSFTQGTVLLVYA